MQQLLKTFFGLTLLTALTACTSPQVDKNSPQFSQTQYLTDLTVCNGFGALTGTIHGLGSATYGAAIGTVNGLIYGAGIGDVDELAAIGAAAGGVIGFGLGVDEALDKRKRDTQDCLINKGYAL